MFESFRNLAKLFCNALFGIILNSLTILAADQNIIFSQAEKITAGISGIVDLPSDSNSKFFAFLLPLDKALSYSVRFLIAPSYQTEVTNSRFHFPFAESEKYVLGVYEDSQPNGLLDIGKERFALAPGSPFTYSNNPLSFSISLKQVKPLQLKMEDFPQDSPIYCQVFSLNMDRLYVIPVKPPEISLFNLPLPVRIGFAEDKNQDLRLDISEVPKLSYLIERHTDEVLSVQWNKKWNSLTLQFSEEAALFPKKLVSITSQESTPLSSQSNIFFFDFKEGEYRIDYEIPHAPFFLSSPQFLHQGETRKEFDFTPKYKIFLERPPERKNILIDLENSIPYTVPGTNIITVYQPGNYKLIAFDENDDNGELDDYKLFNDGLIFYETLLTDKSSEEPVKAVFGGERKILKGNYNLYSTTQQRGQVIFFQKTIRDKIFNTLQVLPLRKAGRRKYLKFYFQIDPSEPFLSFIDFDENFLISGDEAAYLREFDASDPAFFEMTHSLNFPIVNLGSLEISMDHEKVHAHFLEVFSPGKTEAIASTFLSSEPTILYQLPIEVDLILKVTFDVNENKELDDTDKVYPEQTVLIPFDDKNRKHRITF